MTASQDEVLKHATFDDSWNLVGALFHRAGLLLSLQTDLLITIRFVALVHRPILSQAARNLPPIANASAEFSPNC